MFVSFRFVTKNLRFQSSTLSREFSGISGHQKFSQKCKKNQYTTKLKLKYLMNMQRGGVSSYGSSKEYSANFMEILKKLSDSA